MQQTQSEYYQQSAMLPLPIAHKWEQLQAIFETLNAELKEKVSMQLFFLVGAFSFKEKSPTITVASFFSFFFRQTTELIAYVPLFTETDKTTQAKSGQWKLSAKGPTFHFLPF